MFNTPRHVFVCIRQGQAWQVAQLAQRGRHSGLVALVGGLPGARHSCAIWPRRPARGALDHGGGRRDCRACSCWLRVRPPVSRHRASAAPAPLFPTMSLRSADATVFSLSPIGTESPSYATAQTTHPWCFLFLTQPYIPPEHFLFEPLKLPQACYQ